MSEGYFVALLLTCGVSIGFALHALSLAQYSRQAKYLYLAAFAIIEAVYCFAIHQYFRALDPRLALPWGRAIAIITPSSVWILGQLVIELLPYRAPWIRYLQRANLVLTVAATVAQILDAFAGTHFALTGVVYTDLSTMHRHRLEFTSLGKVWLTWIFVVFVVFTALLVRGYRARRYLLPMVLGCVAYFVTTIADFGILFGFYDTYFVEHIGFFFLTFGVWRVVSGRYEQSLGELRTALESLEAQRRALLVTAPAVQAKKLEAVGEFAAGVAHEINNPIQGIMNYGRLLQKRAENGSEPHQFATEIVEECHRVAEIIDALLSFSRIEDRELGSTSVEALIDQTLKLTRASLIEHGIRVEVELADGIPAIEGSAQQMRQVIMNLLTNARDALDARDPARHDEKVIRIEAKSEVRAGETWLLVDVVDNADGIDQTLCGRIFDPFFTTKPPGRGTGLGLTISQGILGARGGSLAVESVVGEGSRFRMEVSSVALLKRPERPAPPGLGF